MLQVTLNNTIIRNLGGVAKAIDQFEKGIAAFNASLVATLQVMKNNMYFANWMGLVMIAASRTQMEMLKYSCYSLFDYLETENG